jgi:hypothetical protein
LLALGVPGASGDLAVVWSGSFFFRCMPHVPNGGGGAAPSSGPLAEAREAACADAASKHGREAKRNRHTTTTVPRQAEAG